MLSSPSYERRASEVLPRVYLTDIFTARDGSQRSNLGITHLISVIEQEYASTYPLAGGTLHIPVSDSPDEDILAHFPATTSFIRDALAESPDSRVMVYCSAGISRSVTVVCAYLVATERKTPHEALVAVREKRGYVCPNIGFMRQLDEYAQQLQGGQSSAGARPKEPNTGSSSSTLTSTSPTCQ